MPLPSIRKPARPRALHAPEILEWLGRGLAGPYHSSIDSLGRDGRPDHPRSKTFCSGALLILFLSVVFFFVDTSHAMSSDERLLFANGLYRRAMYELAVPEYQSLMTNTVLQKDLDLASFRLGECFRSLERNSDAVKAYNTVVRDFPDSEFADRAAFRIAEINWMTEKFEQGAEGFTALLASEPADDIKAASLYYLSLCQSELGKNAEAEKNLRRLLKKQAQSPYADYARIALVNVLGRKDGNNEEMAALLNEVAKKPETPALGAEATARAGLLAYQAQDMKTAARHFQKLADEYAGNAWVEQTRLEAAWAFALDGRYDIARKYAEDGIEGLKGRDQAAWLYLSANIERRAGNTDNAQEYYDELLQKAPAHELAGAAAFESCSLAYKAADYERVLLLADKAGSVEENALQVLWMKASALEELGRREKAAPVYQQVVTEYETSDLAPSAAYRLALFKEQAGEIAEAAKDFESVAKNYPESSIAPDSLMAAASAYMQVDNAKNAAAAWSRLLKNDQDYASRDEAFLGLARAQIMLDRKGSAGKSLQALLSEFSTSPYLAEANYLRGTLFEEEELYEEAEFHYLKSLKLKPSKKLQQQVQYRRVAVLQRQGRNDAAADLMNGLLAGGEGDQLPSPLLEWLARWNLENKQDAEAVTAAALLAETGDAAGWRQIGCYIQGVASLRLKKTKNAETAFKKAVAFGLMTRETADSYYQLGLMALEKKKPEDAVSSFSSAGEYAATGDTLDIRANSYLQLGRAYEAMEKWDDAGRYYLSVGVLFDDPELTPESLYRAAGMLHTQLKNKERDKVLEELRGQYPESDWVKRANERWPAVQEVEDPQPRGP